MIRFIDRPEIERSVTMRDAIEVMRGAFAQLSSGEADVPLRGSIHTAGGVTLTMPAYLRGSEVLGVKLVSVYEGNREWNLPAITALVVLLDAATGQPQAILEGTCLTALRTGAASGLATDLLARPDASVLAIFGAGAQARTQIAGVRAVREIREVRIISLSRAAAETLAAEVPQARVVATPAEAVRGADIIVTATNSRTPVFDGADLAPGTHINAIGSFRPDMCELDETTVRRARVIVDQQQAALAEAGELIAAQAVIDAELGEIVSGARPGRSNGHEITLFKSVGNAVQDVALAQAVVEALGIEARVGEALAREPAT